MRASSMCASLNSFTIAEAVSPNRFGSTIVALQARRS
jgi:hypothetical protein